MRRPPSSFCFFGSGALIPILPYLFGLQGTTAILVAAMLVGLTLVATGAVVGLLSAASPIRRGLRQLLIGYGAAATTYLLGLAFGASISLPAPSWHKMVDSGAANRMYSTVNSCHRYLGKSSNARPKGGAQPALTPPVDSHRQRLLHHGQERPTPCGPGSSPRPH